MSGQAVRPGVMAVLVSLVLALFLAPATWADPGDPGDPAARTPRRG